MLRKMIPLLALSFAPLLHGADTPQPASNDPTPTLVTLHYQNARPNIILDDLYKQIGYPYESHPDAPAKWPAVSIDIDQKPYWEAIASLQDSLHITAHLKDGKIIINRYDENGFNPERGVRCIAGPCLLIARNVRNNINFKEPDQPRDCAVMLTLLVEPHIRLAAFYSKSQPDSAVDENGKTLLGPPLKPVHETPKSDTYITIELPLQPAPDAGHKIATLKGTLQLQCFDQIQNVEIAAADFDKSRNIDFLGATLKLSPIKPMNDVYNGYHVAIDVRRNGLSDEDWAKVNALIDASTINMVDDKDRRYFHTGGGGSGGNANRIRSESLAPKFGLTKSEDVLGPPAKCIIELPLSLRDVTIPYEFKDLPLP